VDGSDDLDDLLGPFRAAPGDAAILSDFDGTLAPIVLDPDRAVPLPGAVDVLHALARRYARVAVVSGRPVSFLARHLRLDEAPALEAIGLYGLERMSGGQLLEPPDAGRWREQAEQIAVRAERAAPPGVTVERKGLSVTLHYRAAPEAAAWTAAFAAEVAADTGLVVHPGKMHDELRPPVDIDKGTIVTELAQGLSSVCFLGDDLGDVPAFAALDALQSSAGVHTLKVVATSVELAEEVRAAGDVVVDGPEGALEVLRALLS
jgi:trehalose 6-phosphate phosphatase